MKENVLFIDDDSEELKIFLEAMGSIPVPIKCIYARDGYHAREILQSVKPAYIFVDYHLPAMDGLQCISLLRQQKRAKGAKIYLYSGRLTEELRKKAAMFGATGCFEKKDTLDSIIAELRKAFQPSIIDFTNLQSPGNSN